MRCSRMDETSVGDAFASAAYPRIDFDAALKAAGAEVRPAETLDAETATVRVDDLNACLNIMLTTRSVR